MRILFLSRWFPYPTDNGSKLRIWNLLRGLSVQHEITLLSFAEFDSAIPDVSALQTMCEEVRIIPWHSYDPHSQRARKGFFSLTPRSYVDTFSQEMADCIKETISSATFDLIIASEWEMAGYSSYFGGMPALFEEIELGVLHDQYVEARTIKHRLRHGLTWYKHRHYLSRLLKDFQVCTVVSEQEQRLLNKTVPGYGRSEIIPNCIDLASYGDAGVIPQQNQLVFTGSFRYAANYDAMVWFLQKIYPQIQSEVPDVHLTITGDHADLALPSTKGVTQTGFVSDVRPCIASAWASVVPLRSGGGTRLKILEAMALGTPVVTTTKGAEGLDAKHGNVVLIADEPKEFASAVNRLFKEPGLREHLADNAVQLVREQYDWAGVMPRFMKLIDDTVQARREQ